MKKQSLLIVIVLIVLAAMYVIWSGGTLSKQTANDILPTLTASDATGDIEKDLNAIAPTDEDEGFTEINKDINSL